MHTFRQLLGLCLGVLLIGGTAMAQPMSGTYTIGDGTPADSFTSFTAAVAGLTANGVGGPVTFDVEQLTYSESITIGQITGASATNTITFRDAGTLDTPPEIVGSTSPAVNLNGADYVTFDGIDITLTIAGITVQMTENAEYNVIKNCLLTGASQTQTNATYGVRTMGGETASGNNYNVIENVTVNRSVYYPVFLAGGVSIIPDIGNEVRNCTLIGGTIGVTVNFQDGAVVRDCDIQPGYDGATEEVIGIFASYRTVCQLYGNKIHNIRGAGITKGISVNLITSEYLVRAYNNFVYDYVVTGSGALYGLHVAGGTAELCFNSVYVGDVGTTGAAYGFYQVGGSTTIVLLKNNIFQIEEPTTACWAIYRDDGTLASDYNCVYSSGPGALYNVGYTGGTNPLSYPTIMEWQAAGFDVHSVEGNPGFISATDLHIQPHFSLLNGMGIDVAGITSDIDGGGRGSPPDIGADEYAHTPMAHDYGVNKWVGWVYSYVASTPVVIRAEVKNYGTSDETDVPVRLSYNGVQQDSVLLSLTSGEADTVELDWTPPAVDWEVGTLVVKAFCPSDTFAPNDSIRAKVSVARPPMSGEYDLGGGANDYATFGAASTALTLRGVSGAVTFNVYPLTYSESITIGQIRGASATNTITFREAPTHLDTPPEIVGSTSPAVNLNGADYVTFDGIDISVTVVGTAVQITGDADHNVIKNCLLTGASQSSTTQGVYITGGGNDYNVIDNVTVNQSVSYPVRLDGLSATRDLGNEVSHCTLIGGLYGVYMRYQDGVVVRGCDVQPGGIGATAYGIYCVSTTACQVYGNKIHNIRGSGAHAIYTNVGTGGLFRAYNNFVWDFVVTGSNVVSGLRVAGGTAELYFNSVYIGDVGATGNTYAFYESGTSTVILKNNIFQIEEPTAACWAINRNAGTLTSDFNCVYSSGPGALYNMGRDGSTNYATLALWQAGTGFDLNSVAGNPGFIGPTNLHIDPLATLVDSAGTPIAGINDDIDGDGRDAAFPDIGADEYPPGVHDFGVIGFVGLLAEYVSQTPYTIQADVQNNGIFNETNVPVRLYYDGVLQSTMLVTLAAGIRDTIDFAWTTPDTSYEVDTLEAQAFCPNDAVPPNDSALASATVVRPPEAVDSLTIFPDVVAGDALLRWAPAAGAHSYKVYRGDVYGFVVDGTTYIGQTASTTYTDVDVLATTGEKYYVVLASTDIIARGR